MKPTYSLRLKTHKKRLRAEDLDALLVTSAADWYYLSGFTGEAGILVVDTQANRHAVIGGDTTFGEANQVFPFASIGQIPQDLKFRGEHTRLVIGSRNRFREFCTVHLGTEGGGGVTRIGDGCLVMANSHVAHDVQLGDGCILANCASLAGHVVVEDHVIFGGLTAAHQQTRVGRLAFISGMSGVGMDVAPYCTVSGARAELAGINLVGMKRAGMDGRV